MVAAMAVAGAACPPSLHLVRCSGGVSSCSTSSSSSSSSTSSSSLPSLPSSPSSPSASLEILRIKKPRLLSSAAGYGSCASGRSVPAASSPSPSSSGSSLFGQKVKGSLAMSGGGNQAGNFKRCTHQSPLPVPESGRSPWETTSHERTRTETRTTVDGGTVMRKTTTSITRCGVGGRSRGGSGERERAVAAATAGGGGGGGGRGVLVGVFSQSKSAASIACSSSSSRSSESASTSTSTTTTTAIAGGGEGGRSRRSGDHSGAEPTLPTGRSSSRSSRKGKTAPAVTASVVEPRQDLVVLKNNLVADGHQQANPGIDLPFRLGAADALEIAYRDDPAFSLQQAYARSYIIPDVAPPTIDHLTDGIDLPFPSHLTAHRNQRCAEKRNDLIFHPSPTSSPSCPPPPPPPPPSSSYPSSSSSSSSSCQSGDPSLTDVRSSSTSVSLSPSPSRSRRGRKSVVQLLGVGEGTDGLTVRQKKLEEEEEEEEEGGEEKEEVKMEKKRAASTRRKSIGSSVQKVKGKRLKGKDEGKKGGGGGGAGGGGGGGEGEREGAEMKKESAPVSEMRTGGNQKTGNGRKKKSGGEGEEEREGEGEGKKKGKSMERREVEGEVIVVRSKGRRRPCLSSRVALRKLLRERGTDKRPLIGVYQGPEGVLKLSEFGGKTAERIRASKLLHDKDVGLSSVDWNGPGHPLLTAEEEIKLCRLVKQMKPLRILRRDLQAQLGSEPTEQQVADAAGMDIMELRRTEQAGRLAMDKLIQRNLRLVLSMAVRYHKPEGLSLEDLCQEGTLGLIRGVEKFDPSRGFRFSTYAHYWIRNAILRALLKGRMIRAPVAAGNEIMAMKKAQLELLLKNQRPPTDAEVSEFMGKRVSRLRELRNAMQSIVSLNEKSSKTGEERLVDIADSVNVEAQVMKRLMLKSDVRDMLDALHPKERVVLRQRFGLDGLGDRSLQDIGSYLNLSREMVRKYEGRAMLKMKNASRMDQLRQYLVGPGTES